MRGYWNVTILPVFSKNAHLGGHHVARRRDRELLHLLRWELFRLGVVCDGGVSDDSQIK